MPDLPSTLAPFSGAVTEVMRALWMSGPVWDGNLPSKAGRDDLVRLGYAARTGGFNFLTTAGVDMAIALFNASPKTDKTR